MWLRLTLLSSVAVSLAAAGYGLGTSRSTQKEPSKTSSTPVANLPSDHPLRVALQTTKDPGIKAQLQSVSLDLARQEQNLKAQAPEMVRALQLELVQRQKQIDQLRVQLDRSQKTSKPMVEKRIQQVQATQRAVMATKQHIDQVIEGKVRRDAAEATLALIDKETKDQIFTIIAVQQSLDANKDFALMAALDSRYALKLTPQQVTQLQFLQSDFLRYFAPLREQYELLDSDPNQGIFEVTCDLVLSDKSKDKTKSITVLSREQLKTVPDKAIPIDVKQDRSVTEQDVLLKFVDTKAQRTKAEVVELPAVGTLKLVGEGNGERERLEKQLAELKQKYNLKTYAVLNPEQQRKLKAILDQARDK